MSKYVHKFDMSIGNIKHRSNSSGCLGRSTAKSQTSDFNNGFYFGYIPLRVQQWLDDDDEDDDDDDDDDDDGTYRPVPKVVICYRL